MAFSRQRLALMGIDLWVVQGAATQHSDETLWRDVTSAVSTALNQVSFNKVHPQAIIQTSSTRETHLADVAQDDPFVNDFFEDESSINDLVINDSAVRQPMSSVHIHSHQQPSAPQHLHESEPLYSPQQLSEQYVSEQHASQQHPSESDAYSAIPDISLHVQNAHSISEADLANVLDVANTQRLDNHGLQLEACSYEQVILLVNVSDLDAQAKLLWHNIQRGLNGQFAQLVWPSAFTEWQELRGLAAYISGFLAAYAAQKTILVLGECSPLNGLCVSQSMPSLNAMLANPLLKQQLWHCIRECNNSLALI